MKTAANRVCNDSGRRTGRVASYDMTVRAENDNALLLVDISQSSAADDLVSVTLVEVTGGHVEVTFFARMATAAVWNVGERVILRSEVNVSDGDWHRVEITRYE